MIVRIATTAIAVALGLALAGCDQGPQQPAAVATPAPAAVPTPKPLSALPDTVQGRWGALPSDCASGGGTLMSAAAATLTFANSKAKVRDIVEIRPKTYTATLDYTNRMGNWSSPTTITLQDGGKSLQKQDTHPSAMTTYTRCPG